MKFIIDASADSRGLRAMLIKQGHDVVTAAEIGPGTPDDVLLARAAREQRVLITEDKVPAARVGVFVGNAWDPAPGRETPWIDLARQLAGDRGRRGSG